LERNLQDSMAEKKRIEDEKQRLIETMTTLTEQKGKL
jgi:hypothetical protein